MSLVSRSLFSTSPSVESVSDHVAISGQWAPMNDDCRQITNGRKNVPYEVAHGIRKKGKWKPMGVDDLVTGFKVSERCVIGV